MCPPAVSSSSSHAASSAPRPSERASATRTIATGTTPSAARPKRTARPHPQIGRQREEPHVQRRDEQRGGIGVGDPHDTCDRGRDEHDDDACARLAALHLVGAQRAQHGGPQPEPGRARRRGRRRAARPARRAAPAARPARRAPPPSSPIAPSTIANSAVSANGSVLAAVQRSQTPIRLAAAAQRRERVDGGHDHRQQQRADEQAHGPDGQDLAARQQVAAGGLRADRARGGRGVEHRDRAQRGAPEGLHAIARDRRVGGRREVAADRQQHGGQPAGQQRPLLAERRGHREAGELAQRARRARARAGLGPHGLLDGRAQALRRRAERVGPAGDERRARRCARRGRRARARRRPARR